MKMRSTQHDACRPRPANSPRSLPSQISVLFVVGLLAGACSSGATSAPPEVTARAAAPVTADPGPAPLPTSAADTPSATAQTELVAIGDSFIGWSTVAEQLADLIAVGVDGEVNVEKITSVTTNRLDHIRNDDKAQSLVADADVIVVQPQPGPPSGPAWALHKAGDCGGPDNQDCFREALADFDLYIGELFDELISSSSDDTAIIAALVGAWGVAAFNPGIEQDDPEMFRLFVDHVIALQELSAAAAATRGIDTVDVTLAFHGPDPYQPAAQDYLLFDRTHLTDEGSRVVAELLYALLQSE